MNHGDFRGDTMPPAPRLWLAAVELDGFRVHAWSDDLVQDVKPMRRRARKPSLRTIIRQAIKAGARVDIDLATGKISIVADESGETQPEDDGWRDALQ
jgi:hypothetical protein